MLPASDLIVPTFIGGRKCVDNPQDFQTGIAMNTELRSAAVATSWNPSSPETPRYSLSFNMNDAALFSATSLPLRTPTSSTRVGGSSVPPATTAGLSESTDWRACIPQTTFVASAGNAGPNPNTVSGIAAGYNSANAGRWISDLVLQADAVGRCGSNLARRHTKYQLPGLFKRCCVRPRRTIPMMTSPRKPVCGSGTGAMDP